MPPNGNRRATVGWRKPVVLLSDSWQSWTPDQLRSVLAHEIAHITRGDFLATVAAQVGVVLHFYHPLVHGWRIACGWSRSWLQMPWQRKSWGARGLSECDRRTGAETIERTLGWPAHSFCQPRRTFLRRIEMLRDLKFSVGWQFALAKWPRWRAWQL